MDSSFNMSSNDELWDFAEENAQTDPVYDLSKMSREEVVQLLGNIDPGKLEGLIMSIRIATKGNHDNAIKLANIMFALQTILRLGVITLV